MIFTSILRQALVVMITHTPIRSVRTFFLWKLTAMTDLQMGHLILMMPSTVSGSASNNLLFLQHGQATCTSCISFRLPQEASQKGMSNWPLVIFFIFHCTVCRDLNPMVAINIVYRTCVLLSIIFALPRKSWRSFIRLNLRQNLYLQISGSKTVKYNYSAQSIQQSIHQNTLNCSIINFYSVILKSKFIITDFNSVFTVVKSLSLC